MKRQIERSDCPRGGLLWLYTKDFKTKYPVATSCKTWNCRMCQKRLMALVKMRVEYGSLTLGNCALITITLKASPASESNTAPFVSKAFRELLRRLKKNPSNANLAWFKIVELTKKGTPHLHLVVGGIASPKYHCTTHPHQWSKTWVEAGCTPLCVEHEWSQLWLKITGHSYIVHVTEVRNAKGAANYVAKYMAKGFHLARAQLVSLGFERRWSRSRNWPGSQLQLSQTVEPGWGYGLFVHRYLADWAEAERRFVDLPRAGTDLALDLAAKRIKRTRVNALRKALQGGSHVVSS